jgi:hypothetical protein
LFRNFRGIRRHPGDELSDIGVGCPSNATRRGPPLDRATGSDNLPRIAAEE